MRGRLSGCLYAHLLRKACVTRDMSTRVPYLSRGMFTVKWRLFLPVVHAVFPSDEADGYFEISADKIYHYP